ncbi:hypothetical protein NC651_000213 [Populus alba x Populus x berolinensis]|nr:hypothetical protein NC651_000213 [Populus alba x Populus x berolinensis]
MRVRDAVVGGWSKERELGLGLAEMEEAKDDVFRVGLLCQWAAAREEEGGAL